MAASGHPLAERDEIGVEDLDRTPFITRENGTRTRQLVRNWTQTLEDSGKSLKVIELENVETAKRIVEEGFGITVIPETAVKREIAANQLVRINLKGFKEEAIFYLLYHKARRLSVAAKTFLSMLPGTFVCSDNLGSDLDSLIK